MTRTKSLKIQHDSLVDEIIALKREGKWSLVEPRRAQLAAVTRELNAPTLSR